MKHLILFTGLAAMLAFAACQSSSSKKTAPNATDSLINNPRDAAQGANQPGALLITKNDCLTCHRINEKVIGPSYQDIANKYEANAGNVDNLANEIIKGQKGVWGETPMTPHPTLQFSDAQEMVRYILSLKK